MTLPADQERARRLATTIVALALGIAGVTLIAFGIVLLVSGGAAFLLLSVLLFLGGAVLAALGFFFQLVPFKLAELAERKRDYDRRTRGERP